MTKKFCQIADKLDSGKIAEFLSKDGQLLLPVQEWLPEKELVYFILDAVRELDLTAISAKHEHEERRYRRPRIASDSMSLRRILCHLCIRPAPV